MGRSCRQGARWIRRRAELGDAEQYRDPRPAATGGRCNPHRSGHRERTDRRAAGRAGVGGARLPTMTSTARRSCGKRDALAEKLESWPRSMSPASVCCRKTHETLGRFIYWRTRRQPPCWRPVESLKGEGNLRRPARIRDHGHRAPHAAVHPPLDKTSARRLSRGGSRLLPGAGGDRLPGAGGVPAFVFLRVGGRIVGAGLRGLLSFLPA